MLLLLLLRLLTLSHRRGMLVLGTAARPINIRSTARRVGE